MSTVMGATSYAQLREMAHEMKSARVASISVARAIATELLADAFLVLEVPQDAFDVDPPLAEAPVDDDGWLELRLNCCW